MSRLGVTDHCVEQFIKRTTQGRPLLEISEYKARKTRVKILEMVKKSTQVELKPGYRASNVVLNGMRHSIFMRFNDWVFVLDPKFTTVITCYPSSALRWINIGPQTPAGKALSRQKT